MVNDEHNTSDHLAIAIVESAIDCYPIGFVACWSPTSIVMIRLYKECNGKMEYKIRSETRSFVENPHSS